MQVTDQEPGVKPAPPCRRAGPGRRLSALKLASGNFFSVPSVIGAIAQAFSCLLLVLLGTGPALPLLHFGLTQHELCPEHGELVHTEGAARADHHGGEAPGLYDAPGFSHEHDHCLASAVQAPRATLAKAPAPVLLDPGDGSTSLLIESRDAHPSVSILALAPKLPPPV